ncbi:MULTISPECIES: bifunctional UDP-N-acetylglucosamine diphosphorylase/glucosamine-1-phosphate N-acetyltransferase GlmU [Bacillus]|jgi:bifunctional UDP-N-acetylglucosamine pyrophosphorylase/glucosamine-1-phosphate N-acetyltransferase|uniref:bifunctional UDP-N-acetylglucosamine diphosphorylase/glucosamine-1-phosphate N-acetyltransferase GlmU n=1 Tax=Bacillus TaxID=1386 RepID=UPI0002B3FE94|nr:MULTISPECIES: bifunctional UDP-N-acetylglucosamine diphosphorylase/glucosamine-1-phosphate N-acetyltransferase GlmU [Bacillus]AOL31870.1 UDP-N-acetylglucosamine diphosphorylase/glucosamine-1-phosphate N-acetyltransferase [Alkalicoccobacillus gibsonii]MDP4100034.1 bifunctional UDP-N-acetylglucosamine diphosphorylase/glucosamine-1-phosphate N-acetyltransferase GlmU [Bacillota bacterium]MUG03456.1 bifunctional UDP-N-acetylglucosamine diphosphorylase/glucosamine-1-phosphate N-acetyltransferase Gl
MDKRFAVVLAAGQGTRMKSKLYKVLHPVCGKPMVEHVVDEALKLSLSKLVTIVGHGAEEVKKQLGDKSEYALQAEQLGTAHAVKQAQPFLADEKGVTIVICGDTPLLTAETMEQMLKEHTQREAKATILTAVAEDPTGYGRIIRSENGAVQKIVEHKDASEEERLVTEINTGTYCFDNEALFRAIDQVSNDNAQGEYYLPDVIEILKNEGETVAAYQTGNFQETLGVNDRVALSQAEQFMKERINKRHMQNGVTLIDPMNTYISPDAVIGSDTVIYPGTVIKGEVQIGEDTIIGPHTEIMNSAIGSRTVIKQSVVNHSKVGNDVNIGPFAHIRPDSVIGNEVKIGNFVEIKKTQFGDRSKASHLSYVGDAEVGTDVNLGCGSITVNYDGKNKYLTKIEDGAFIGCNSNLVAPVTVGEGAYVAAGSTVTEDVPGKALAIARARQVNKDDYVKNIHKK